MASPLLAGDGPVVTSSLASTCSQAAKLAAAVALTGRAEDRLVPPAPSVPHPARGPLGVPQRHAHRASAGLPGTAQARPPCVALCSRRHASGTGRSPLQAPRRTIRAGSGHRSVRPCGPGRAISAKQGTGCRTREAPHTPASDLYGLCGFPRSLPPAPWRHRPGHHRLAAVADGDVLHHHRLPVAVPQPVQGERGAREGLHHPR
jgi:hypothetical protein